MSHDLASCPKCGRPSRLLREAIATQLEKIRQVESQPPPATDEPSVARPGGGTHAGSEQLLVGMVAQPLLDLGSAAIDAAVVKPASEWWKTTGQAKMRERREKMVETLNAALDRHSELFVCATENLAFLQGGSRTVPVNEAVRLLLKHDDEGLMSRLRS